MLTMALCDDNINDLNTIKGFINEFSMEKQLDIMLDTFTCSKELLNSPIHYNVFILDIMLGTENGIKIGQQLRIKNKTSFIIYITNYRQYQGIAQNAIHSFAFLQKPISKANIYEQLTDVLSYNPDVSSNNFYRFFTYEEGLIELNIDDIYFFEYIKKRYVKIVTKNKFYHFNQKINVLSGMMACYDFCMPHQSFVVNLKYVKDVKHYELLMVDGTKIPLSQKRAVLFKDALNNYLKKMLML